MKSPAITFVTHLETRRIGAHFERLRRETRGVAPTFLCVHEPQPKKCKERVLTADLRITPEHGARMLPTRDNQRLARGGSYRGFNDLVHIPALLSPLLEDFDPL